MRDYTRDAVNILARLPCAMRLSRCPIRTKTTTIRLVPHPSILSYVRHSSRVVILISAHPRLIRANVFINFLMVIQLFSNLTLDHCSYSGTCRLMTRWLPSSSDLMMCPVYVF